ncbi:MAG: ABC transporter ATP-binding protein [Methylococcales bacterium]|nr:ABC transporter ATP-binding protein [Methylococcales bacterium]
MSQSPVNPTENIIIEAKELSKTVFSSHTKLDILSAVNLRIQLGESLAIIGESGSGKSTLLGLLAGLDSPTTGHIDINGRNITMLSEDQRAVIRSQSIGFVFQSFQLLPNLTALENVMLPLELLGEDEAEYDAKSFLDRVGLKERMHHVPKKLSGGEQQRVALARAFVTRPAILLADEPTGNLDSRTGKYIIDLLFTLNQEQQTTLVLVTHDKALASRCHRSVILREGRLA